MESFAQLVEYLHNHEKYPCEHNARRGDTRDFKITIFAK